MESQSTNSYYFYAVSIQFWSKDRAVFSIEKMRRVGLTVTVYCD